MENISIRLATEDDVPVIHRLLTDLAQALDMQSTVKRKAEDILRFGFSETPFFEALIAWRDTEPVGLALYFSEFSTWRGSPGVYVQDLYVSAEVRGSGLGRQLMDSVIERSRSWDATYCKLSVYNENEAAMAFYLSLGFHISEHEKVLVIDGL